MITLINTFSPNMIKGDGFTVFFEKFSLEDSCNWLNSNNFTSAISSKEVAYLFSSLLQIPLGVKNVNICFDHGSQAILGLYKGPKIKNKQKKLTYNSCVNWYLITID